MKFKDKSILISPSDLNNFVSCKYLIINEIKYLKKLIKKNEETIDQKLWKKYGLDHEKKYLEIFKKDYKEIVSINQDETEEIRNKKTIDAIKSGYDLIYHGFLIDDNFRGEVDFLIKTKKPSDLGDYSYVVYDTKVSRKPRPRHIYQITAYSHMLSKVQGVLPEKMYLIDGADIFHHFKPKEILDLYLFKKYNFEKFIKNVENEKIYPEKCNHCALCSFADECKKIWEDDNYINQVAKITSSQIEKLKKVGINTVEKLSKSNPDNLNVKINNQTLKNLISQAQLQEEKRLTGKSKYIVLDPDPGKGFYKLPEPNKGDLFFDIEGFPQEDGRGFEYLHGIYLESKDGYDFKPFWAKDFKKEFEKKNFINLIEFFKSHFEKYPKANLYHYNSYEKRALRQLASLYSSDFPEGINFVDYLLRAEKFVDLFLIVNQCVRTSEKDMSLKTIEEILYGFKRIGDIQKAEDSVKLYDYWLTSKDEKTKQNIIDYNKEDCESTFYLREFLVEKKPESIDWFSVTDETEKKSKEKKSWEEIETELLKSLEKEEIKKNPLTETIKNLVGFHRREQKPEWWEIFDRMEKTHDELEDDPECIGNCVLQSPKPEKVDKGVIFTYQFNDQDYKLKKDASVYDVHENSSLGKIEEIIEETPNKNIVKIKLGDKKFSTLGEMPNLVSFCRRSAPNIAVLEQALNKFVNDFILNKKSNYQCIIDLLKRENPNLFNIKSGEPLIDESKDITEESIKIVKQMNSTYLTIQGPPGTGKTYNSARMIIELMKEGKKVGVSSNSHEAIKNLLSEIEKQSTKEKFSFKGMKKSNTTNLFEGKFIKDIIKEKPIDIGDYSLFAGTAWFFSNVRMNQTLDYLFIDEAGQVSLANTISMATSTKNLVLIGDQMQLSQPIKGTHEGYAKLSALDYILEGRDTIPPEQGIFLRETRRLIQ